MIGIGIILLLVDMGFILSAAVAVIGGVLLFYYYGLKKIYNILTIDGTIKHPMLFTAAPQKNNESVKSESNREEEQK